VYRTPKWYTVGKAKHQIQYPFFWSPEFLGVNYWMASLWHILTLLLSIIGGIVYYLNKNRNKIGTLVIATIIYSIVVYLPFFTMGRYFYPAMPLVIIFTAYAVDNLVSSLYNRLTLNGKLTVSRFEN